MISEGDTSLVVSLEGSAVAASASSSSSTQSCDVAVDTQPLQPPSTAVGMTKPPSAIQQPPPYASFVATNKDSSISWYQTRERQSQQQQQELPVRVVNTKESTGNESHSIGERISTLPASADVIMTPQQRRTVSICDMNENEIRINSCSPASNRKLNVMQNSPVGEVTITPERHTTVHHIHYQLPKTHFNSNIETNEKVVFSNGALAAAKKIANTHSTCTSSDFNVHHFSFPIIPSSLSASSLSFKVQLPDHQAPLSPPPSLILGSTNVNSVSPALIAPPTTKGIQNCGSAAATGSSSRCNANTTTTTMMLLSNPNDVYVLSPLHVFVRQQIEVFTATEIDITLPAPGRKHKIQLHQIGLRCIHCRQVPIRDRIKRAVCYPSSIARVYHSVSDMKFDHFAHCKSRPIHIVQQFQLLKNECQNKTTTAKPKRLKPVTTIQTSSSPMSLSSTSSSTAQYYNDSAREMGMMDGPGGLFFRSAPSISATRTTVTTNIDEHHTTNSNNTTTSPQLESNSQPSCSGQAVVSIGSSVVPAVTHAKQQSSMMDDVNKTIQSHHMDATHLQQSSAASMSSNENSIEAASTNLNNSSAGSTTIPALHVCNTSPNRPSTKENIFQMANSVASVAQAKQNLMGTGACCLNSSMDVQFLNPIHCFVRRHIELFIANASDISAPAPGRKTRVVLGQVGIRCIHCATIPMKDRVKRAVCYPAAISGIYHAVSNMKFDHFNKCRALPDHERSIFLSLRSSCGRHGQRSVTAHPISISSSNSSSGSSVTSSSSTHITNTNSTAQYYHDSALALGLIDSENGIRVGASLSSATSTETRNDESSDGTIVPEPPMPSKLTKKRSDLSKTMSPRAAKKKKSTSSLRSARNVSTSSFTSNTSNFKHGSSSSTTSHHKNDGISVLMLAASVRVAAQQQQQKEEDDKAATASSFATNTMEASQPMDRMADVVGDTFFDTTVTKRRREAMV